MASKYETYRDTPYQIKAEGENVTLTFAQGVPVTTRGTVSWNIPEPYVGCDDPVNRAYAGIIVVVDKKPITSFPVDGQVYVSDPTVDSDLHAGDRIGDALVIGAFYECEQVHRNEELTTSFVVDNLKADTPYYVAAFAVDCQHRYHQEGVRAYSDKHGQIPRLDKPSHQFVKINDGNGVPTDATGLDVGVTYQFEIAINEKFPNSQYEEVLLFDVNGTNAQTYQDLMDEINRQFVAHGTAFQSPTPPNAGQFYVNAVEGTIEVFDGYSYSSAGELIVEDTDPSVIVNGTYWYDTGSNETFIWNASWVTVTTIHYDSDPMNPTCDDFWLNPISHSAYKWEGNTWCLLNAVVSEEAPDSPIQLDCGTYWFNTEESVLYKWMFESSTWTDVPAVYWNEDPTALSDGTYWANLLTNEIFVRDTGTWASVVSITDTNEPVTSELNGGDIWYNPTSEELKQWDDVTETWIDLVVLPWEDDPTDVTSCELWWDSTTDELKIWSVVDSEWVVITNFTQSISKPNDPPIFQPGDGWIRLSTNEIFVWDGTQWIARDTIISPIDPTNLSAGITWHSTVTGDWFNWDGTQWVEIDPINSDADPAILPAGSYWYSPVTSTTSMYNGSSWVLLSASYQPLTPTRNQRWVDTSTNQLKIWNGYEWVVSDPIGRVEWSDRGGMSFVSSALGSAVCLMILVPGTLSGVVGTGTADYTDPSLDRYAFSHYGDYADVKITQATVLPEDFLFANLTLATINRQFYGNDAVSATPTYDEVGIGTDGTPDERRKLTDKILIQLGASSVEVELMKQDLEVCIDNALMVFRQHSASAEKRGFFFLDIVPGHQAYVMSNRRLGYHKITTIMSIRRLRSSFLATAGGAYGQQVLQHLYTMGSYDLTSYHLMSQYVEQMEHLFATGIVYSWDEYERRLTMHQKFHYPEKVLLDCMVEKTEQELLVGRYTAKWIQDYALAEARLVLSEIRGKYASLPGAGGGTALNAADLAARSDADKMRLMQEIDDYIANDPTDVGMTGSFIIG